MKKPESEPSKVYGYHPRTKVRKGRIETRDRNNMGRWHKRWWNRAIRRIIKLDPETITDHNRKSGWFL